jgi:hypothetical protein
VNWHVHRDALIIPDFGSRHYSQTAAAFLNNMPRLGYLKSRIDCIGQYRNLTAMQIFFSLVKSEKEIRKMPAVDEGSDAMPKKLPDLHQGHAPTLLQHAFHDALELLEATSE